MFEMNNMEGLEKTSLIKWDKVYCIAENVTDVSAARGGSYRKEDVDFGRVAGINIWAVSTFTVT